MRSIGDGMSHGARDDARPAERIPGGSHTTFRLLERVRAGDEAALEAIFARYLVPLRRWASGRLPSHARGALDTQDLVQDTLLRTLKRIESFVPEHEGALQAYLRQALMNRIRDEIRRVGRRPGADPVDTGLLDPAASPLEEAIGAEALEGYEAALARLDPGDREAIIARVEMGCGYEELAQALGKPTADAARKAAQRALVKLAREMDRGTR
jgi:RNA polymerase sigma-70 factor (ECF subfamily)